MYLLLATQNIRITTINNAYNRAVEKLSASSTQLTVVSTVMVNSCLRKHGQVLHLGLAKRRAVGGNEDHFGFAGAKGFEARLVAEDGLS